MPTATREFLLNSKRDGMKLLFDDIFRHEAQGKRVEISIFDRCGLLE